METSNEYRLSSASIGLFRESEAPIAPLPEEIAALRAAARRLGYRLEKGLQSDALRYSVETILEGSAHFRELFGFLPADEDSDSEDFAVLYVLELNHSRDSIQVLAAQLPSLLGNLWRSERITADGELRFEPSDPSKKTILLSIYNSITIWKEIRS